MVVIDFFAMGSPCRVLIDLIESTSNLKKINYIRSEILNEMNRLEKKYSRFKSDNVLNHINASFQSGVSADIDDETSGLLQYANIAYEISDGLFDITTAPLSRLWDFRRGIIPSEEEIIKAQQSIGWNFITIQNGKVSATKPVSLDFGGIVKEYAADRLAALLHLAECQASLINLGGDIRVVGPKRNNLAWKISIDDFTHRLKDLKIENQFTQSGKETASDSQVFFLKSGAVATSGTDYRGFWINNIWYCHLINPKNGWPIPRTLLSVTTITDLCITAGTLTTTALLYGSEKAKKWLDELSTAYVIRDVNQSWILNDKFKELNDEN